MKKLTGILSFLLVLFCWIGLVTHARGDSGVPTASPGDLSRLPVYLTGKEAVWSAFPKAPPLGSPVDEADLAITLSIQVSRTEDQKREANRDKNYSIRLVTDSIDPKFQTKYPKTWGVLFQADRDGAFITSMIKKVNGRSRPFVQHPTLVLSLFTVPDFSYPSGHSSGSELQARLLGELFPAQADDLLRRARQIADSRVVAGVHYASDTEAGLTLGDLLFQELNANPKFQSDLSHAAKMDGIP